MKSFLTKVGALLMTVVFAFAGCQDYDEDIRKVNEQLNTNTAELTTITEELEAAIEALEAKVANDYATKAALEELKAALQAKDTQLSDAIAAIDAAYKAADAALKSGYETADANLQKKIDDASKAATEAIETLTGMFERTVNQLSTRLSEAEEYTTMVYDVLNGEITTLKATVATLQGDLKTVANNLAAAKTELQAADAAINTRIDGAIANIEKNAQAIEALTALHKKDVELLQGAIAENFTSISALQLQLRDLVAEYEQTVEDLQGAIGENTALIESVRFQLIDHISVYNATIEQLENQVTTNEANITMLQVALKALNDLHVADVELLQAAIADNTTAIEAEVLARINAINELKQLHTTDVNNLEEVINDNERKIGELQFAVRELQAVDEDLQNQITELDKQLQTLRKEVEAYYALKTDVTTTKEQLNKLETDVYAIKADVYKNIEELKNKVGENANKIAEILKTISGIQVDVETIASRVQSLVYVPEYNDAKATINYAIAPYITKDQKTETAIVPAKSVLRYKVNSTSETAVDDIVKAFAQDPSILTYDLENVKLRSAAPELQVVSVRKDEQGYLEVTALAKNFAKEFFYVTLTKEVQSALKQHISNNHPILNGIFDLIFGDGWGEAEVTVVKEPSTSYSAALVLVQADEKNNVASEFTNLIPAKKYGVVSLAARYTNEGKTVVIDSNFGDVVADRNVVKEQFIASYDTVTVAKTCANEPVVSVMGDDAYYTPAEVYAKYGYAVEIQKTHQVVSYTKDGKMDLTQQAAPAWNTELVSYNTDKFIVVDAAATAIGTSRQVSLTAYDEANKVKYDQRVGNYVEVVDAYYLAGQTVAVADKVTITKNLVYINFDAKTYEWTLNRAIALRGDDKTPYAKSIVLNDVNYDNIYNLNPILSDAAATKTVTLNGKANSTVFELSDIVAPEAGKAGRADITIKAGYEFAAANAENANEYVLTWKASLNETTDAIVTINVTLGKYPAAVTVESEVDLDLVAGQTHFDGKDALINDAYVEFAEFTGFAEGAKVNDIMFAALTDEANTMVNDPNSLYNINFDVVENVDKTWVRLYESQIVDNANVAASYVFKRDITTWFGVPFKFIVTAKPHLPEVELVRSTEYASATNEAKVYAVNLQARINEEGIYNVVQSDLAFYLNTIGAANATQKVTFKVVEGEAEIAPATTVNVEPLATPINNPLVGDVTAYLQKEQSILKWTDHGTQIKVKATLWAGAYPIDYATLILNVEDPITFSAGNIVAERIVEKDTPVKVYEKFSLMSTAKTLAGVQAHKGNLIKTNAATIAEILSAEVVKAYGIKIETELVTMYEQVAEGENGKVLYDSSKYSWDKTTGILTLKKDDAAELLHPIVAQIRVKFTHNVHGASDACTETSDIFVTFQQTK